jgi:hypothetical protein
MHRRWWSSAVVLAAMMVGGLAGAGAASADTPADCTRTSEGEFVCVGEEIVVVGQWPDPEIPDLPDGGSEKGDRDGGHGGGGGGCHGCGAGEGDAGSPDGGKAAEAVDERLHAVLRGLMQQVAESRCASSMHAVDAATGRYTEAAARFVVADRELDIAWQEVFLAEAKTYADYYKNGVTVDRQVLDGYINWLTTKIRDAKFELARDKYDEALAAVLAAQPPLDAAIDAYDECVKNPPPPLAPEPPQPGDVSDRVCGKKPNTPGC